MRLCWLLWMMWIKCYLIKAVSNDILISEICHFDQSCALSANVSSSCCRQCSCNEFCEERRTCCQDKNYSMPFKPNIVHQECLPVVNNHIEGILKSKRIPHYFIRSSCPPNSNAELNKACRIMTPQVVDDLQYVSSRDGRVIYRNHFCATCHGETDIVKWNIAIDNNACLYGEDTDVSNLTVIDFNRILLSKCQFYLIPPDNLDTKNIYCVPNDTLILTCAPNITLDPKHAMDCEYNSGRLCFVHFFKRYMDHESSIR